MVLEQLDVHMPKKKKKNLDTAFTSFTKINSKLIIGLNVKHKSIKLLQDRREENLGPLWFGDDFEIQHQKHDL